MKYVAIAISVLYIFIEISFRAKFIDTLGVPVPNEKIINNLEIIGRVISSLGFAFFLSSITNKIIKNLIFKVSFFVFFFVFFFLSQKYIIDNIGYFLTEDFKKESFYLEIEKQNIHALNNKLDNKIYNFDGDYNIEDKIYFISYPIIKGESFLRKSNDEIFRNQVIWYSNFMVENNKGAYIANFDNFHYKMNGIYNNKYLKLSKKTNDIIENSDADIEDIEKGLRVFALNEFFYYRMTILKNFYYNINDSFRYSNVMIDSKTKEVVSQKSKNAVTFKPMTLASYFNENYEFETYDRNGNIVNVNGWNPLKFSKSKNIPFRTTFGVKSNNGEIDILEEYVREIEYFVKNKSANIKSKKDYLVFLENLNSRVGDMLHYRVTSKFSNYNNLESFYSKYKTAINNNFCYYDGSYKTNFLSLKYKGKFVSETKLYLNNEGIPNVCNFDKISSIIKEVSVVNAELANKSYGFNKDINTFSEFINTDYLKSKVSSELGYRGMSVDKHFDFRNSKGLNVAYKKFLNESLERKKKSLASEIFEDFDNIDLPLNLSFYGFINNKDIKSKLIEKYPYFTVNNEMIMYYPRSPENNDKLEDVENKFLLNAVRINSIKLLEFNEDIINGRYNKETLNNYSKIMVVPIFILIVSTIVIILNILTLLTSFIKNKKAKISTFSALFVIIILTSAMFKNEYTESFRKTEYSFIYTSIQNISIFIKLGEPVYKYGVYALNFIEYEYIKNAGDSNDKELEVRRYELNKYFNNFN